MSMTRTRPWTAALALVLVVAALASCRTSGDVHRGQGTFYGGGSFGACGFDQNVGVRYAAMNPVDYANARACGAHVRVTGPEGTVTVQVVDLCPECKAGDVDLGPEAFDLIADPVDGRVPISWQYVSGPDASPVQYQVKDGSNPWWFAIQPRRHRNLVTTLEVQVGGRWVALQRQGYNYFVADAGLGPGPFTVRLTDVHGQQLIHTGIALAPGVVQTASSQFAAH
jgi:expansin (peptidoglycan-binding protein)